MDSQKQEIVLQVFFYGGLILLAMLVMLCGLGLAFGSRRVSVFGFWGALVMLGVLGLLFRKIRGVSSKRRSDMVSRGQGRGAGGR
ncbi:hypothetical protein [Desulfofustis limnaeus]|jgi:hypothetical protein|uniref:LPXTG cell wall anchor domain-containing protein n=1 Tax=Desulfofustis limnaeus TaxID=2740163 RepID=A0ABN6M0V3_9BACT|nr:hypothetical protein [Desulfofustis limnaeus]MDX9895927.1 hypothetical protein [Desulfofustis sp.]BDD86542.1 hypothetical protein DPPLL_09070 [Desulfofustis limnaeus]